MRIVASRSQMSPAKRNRVYLTLSQEKLEQLEWWADQERRPLANMATFLVEVAIDEALANGKLKNPNEAPTQGDRLKSAANLLAKLIDGKDLTPEEEVTLAEACDRAPHNVHNASKKIREKNGNGKPTAKR